MWCVVIVLSVWALLTCPRAGQAQAQTPAEAFADLETVADGLGPRFNGTGCGMCHAHPTLGGTSPPVNPQVAVATALGARNAVPPFITADGPIREVRSDKGDVSQPLFVITGRSDAPAGCLLRQPDFTMGIRRGTLSFRIPTPLFGVALMEAIPDEIISAMQDLTALEAAPLGIVGRPAIVGQRFGKFGWKAQHNNVRGFAADAYNAEMGITTPSFPFELERDPDCQTVPVPNDTETPVELFTTFMRSLPPPPAAPADHPGRTVFTTVGCALCHTPALAGVPLFSDLLLHDMGTGLRDGIRQGSAGPQDFRTAPLWGVGQRLFFLHDGRTNDLTQAILAHESPQSEASAVVGKFRALSAADQAALLAFLKAL